MFRRIYFAGWALLLSLFAVETAPRFCIDLAHDRIPSPSSTSSMDRRLAPLLQIPQPTATLAVGGWGVVLLLSRGRLSCWEHFALAWFFGTSLVSLSFWIGGLFLRGIALQCVVTGICVLIGAIGFGRLRASGSKQREPS